MRTNSRIWWAIRVCGVAPLTSLSVGCSGTDAEPIDDPVQTTTSAIVGGERDDGTPARFPFVGQVRGQFDDGKSLCSATLLSCGAAITAGHCLRRPSVTAASGAVHLASEISDSAGATLFTSSEFVFHPEFEPMPEVGSTARQQSRDLAIMVMKPTSEKGWWASQVRPMRYARMPAPGQLASGATATLVGYGWGQMWNGGCVYEEDESEILNSWTVLNRWHRRWAGMRVNGIDPVGLLGRIRYSASPTGPLPALGDSGGPLLLGDDETIAGVQSVISGSGCASPSAYGPNLSDPSVNAWARSVLEGLDRDGDGAADVCDMCPDTPDDGTDSDGDYVPDACDDCPCDPDEVDPWTDGDKDGVCGLACGSDGPVRLDNCPNVHNPFQENCNAEAEAARSALPLGDACDPVPCPAFSFQHDEFESVGIRVVGGGYVGCTEETLRGKLDAITLSPVGSHGAPDTPEGTRGVEVPVTPDWTEYRYCVDNADLNLDCSNPGNIKDNLIRARTSRVDERFDDAWRRIWIEELDPPAVGSLGVANPADTGIVYGNGTVVTRHWSWLQDFTYWSQAFPQYFSVPTAPIDGRLWAHAQTTVGMTLPENNPVGTGMHPRQGQPNQPADMLANHLRDMSPHFERVKRTCWTTHELWKLGPLARPCPGCPDGAPLFEDPRDDCPNCGALAPLEAGSLLDAQQLVVLPSSKGTLIGILDTDGSIAPVEARLGKTFAASLSTDAVWLSAVEHNPMLGRGAAGPAAVQLSADGTTVTDQLFVRKHRAFSQRDLGVEIPAPTGSSLASSNAGPAPRRGAVGVYARSSGEVFVLGGTHAVTGAALQDIWWRGVDEGASWKQVSTRGYRPGKVLAATRTYQDHKLWVLDEVDVGMRRFARLVRMTPGTGQVEEIGRWSTSGLFDSHWLVLDQDGSVLVAASSRRLRKHGIVRIRADRGGATVDRVLMGTGALGMAPWVDASGYALPIWQSTTKLPKVVRRATLGGSLGSWRDVGQCF